MQNFHWSVHFSTVLTKGLNLQLHAENGFDRFRDTFVTQSDSRFLRFLAIHLCQIELGNLREMAKRQFPTLPLSDLVINVSFVDYKPGEPVKYTLKKLSEFNPSQEAGSNASQKAYLKEKIKEKGGDGAVFNIIAPQTANHSMNFTAVMGGKSFWDGTIFMLDFSKMKDEEILDFGKGIQDIMGVSATFVLSFAWTTPSSHTDWDPLLAAENAHGPNG